MELSNLIPHIEALIFASDKPLTPVEITDLINAAFGFMEDKVQPEQVDAALEGIVEKYGAEFYPFEVRMSGGGWQFLTKKDYHKTVAQLNGEKFLKRLSGAALETLAIIAYKQPITKGEIESIRGVSSDYSVQKLLEKELIIISGRNEKLPGHPLVYATSKNFMDYFGINTADDLPRIKEVLANQVVEPTIVNHTEFEQGEALAVSGEGELVDTGIAAGERPTGLYATAADGLEETDEPRLFLQDGPVGEEEEMQADVTDAVEGPVAEEEGGEEPGGDEDEAEDDQQEASKITPEAEAWADELEDESQTDQSRSDFWPESQTETTEEGAVSSDLPDTSEDEEGAADTAGDEAADRK